jgi:hypothetical protein
VDPGHVVGAVVDGWGRPIAGRKIVLGGRSTVSDESGEFTVDGVGARYDVIVGDPDGATVTVYRGLSRRDPRLAHSPGQRPVPNCSATIDGSITAATPAPPPPTSVEQTMARAAGAMEAETVVDFFGPEASVRHATRAADRCWARSR